MGTAFRLRPLPRVVDNEGVEQRQVLQGYFWVASRRKADALARQPLQRAVFAHVNHCVGLEHVPYPTVVGDVVVGRGQVGTVIDGNRVLSEPPGRLKPHKDVAEVYAGDGQAAVAAVHLPGRVSPSFRHFFRNRRRKAAEPLPVLLARDVAHRHSQLLFGKVLPIVAATFDNAMYEFVAVFRYIGNLVARTLKFFKNSYHRCRSVKSYCVADTGVLGGVVAQDYGDAFFGVRLDPQVGPLDGQAGQVVHAVFMGYVPLQPPGQFPILRCRGLLLERDGHGDNPAVEFG